MKVYERIARLIDGYRRILGETEMKQSIEKEIHAFVKEHMPSGSGWDEGTKIDLVESSDRRLVFRGSFHHMNADGFYVGWTEHTIDVQASMATGFKIRVTGRRKNGITDYLYELFDHALTMDDVTGVSDGKS